MTRTIHGIATSMSLSLPSLSGVSRRTGIRPWKTISKNCSSVSSAGTNHWPTSRQTTATTCSAMPGVTDEFRVTAVAGTSRPAMPGQQFPARRSAIVVSCDTARPRSADAHEQRVLSHAHGPGPGCPDEANRPAGGIAPTARLRRCRRYRGPLHSSPVILPAGESAYPGGFPGRDSGPVSNIGSSVAPPARAHSSACFCASPGERSRPHVYCSCWAPSTSIPRPGAGRIRQPAKAIAGSAQARIMSAKSPPEILDG